ncbi:MAG TPA: C45 family peptidase [Pyrinomonadaceae bacterium]|nr:C45 family peptidase [Pyrinomonadaceae bacterium]
MKRQLSVIALLAMACLSLSGSRLGQWKPTISEDDRLKGSYRFERNGWIYVHLEGSPEQIGYQHGKLLAKEIEDLLRVTRPFLQHETKRNWDFYRKAAQDILWPKIDSEYQGELDGIVKGLNGAGVKADRWDIVALNALEELPYYYVPWLDKQQDRTPTTHAPGNCSAIVATGSYTSDHRIVMGHNNWTNYAIGSRWNIIFDIKPKNGYRILMDGLPGVIASDDDFGINSAGIMITETTITGFSLFDPAGKPEFYRARKAMQYSNSIDDYVRIMLDGNNGGYANDWLLGDNKTGEIALFELGLKEHSVRRTTDGYFVGANFPVDPKLAKTETNFDFNNLGSSPLARKARWEQLVAESKGSIDVEAVKRMEGDKYDAFEKKEGPNERSLCGCVERSPRGIPEWDWDKFFPGGTVQAKAVDGRMASTMQLWAAMGHSCGYDFNAAAFLQEHPNYKWMKDILRDMPSRPWTAFNSGMR